MSIQNLDSGFADYSPVDAGGPTISSCPPSFPGGVGAPEEVFVQKLINALSYNYEYPKQNDSYLREEALDLLSKNREICADLGHKLWNSFGTIFTLVEGKSGVPLVAHEQYAEPREVENKNPPPLNVNASDGKAFVDLLLKPSEEDLKVWPHSFEFRLRVSLAVDGSLNLITRIRNINSKPYSFSFAFHTYFSVSDISEVRVEGLETIDYLDNLREKQRFTEQGDALTFESEVDRVYLRSSNVIAVLDHEKKRTCVIKKDGLPDVG